MTTDHWKTQTCEGGRFRVATECRRFPPVYIAEEDRSLFPMIFDEVGDRMEYCFACAEYQPEEESK